MAKMKRPGFLKFTLFVGILAVIGGIYFLEIALLPPTAQYFNNQGYRFLQMDFQQVLVSAFILLVTGLACILLGTVKPKPDDPVESDKNR